MADRRGFFYETPAAGLKAPNSDTAKRVQIDGFIHGASFSKDGKLIIMAVGEQNQERDYDILSYSLDDGSTAIIAKSLAGWAPDDPGFGRKLPVRFQDDGERVYFALYDRKTGREIRYAYLWSEGQMSDWKPPVEPNAWSAFSPSSDNRFRNYANGGLYLDGRQVPGSDKLSYWPLHWLNGTHLGANIGLDYDRAGNKQYTSYLQLLDADTMEQKVLYKGLHMDSQVLGVSIDGGWIYVSARKPSAGPPLPEDDFGRWEGKLLANVKPDANAPIALNLHGNTLRTVHSALIEDGLLFVPLRDVLEAGGWTISWTQEGRIVTGKKQGRSDRIFQFSIDRQEGVFNGFTSHLIAAPKLIDNTTYLYAGTLQQLGIKLDWDEGKRILLMEESQETGGVTLADGTWYEGELRGDIPWGIGMLFDQEGRLLHEGEFTDGRYQGLK